VPQKPKYKKKKLTRDRAESGSKTRFKNWIPPLHRSIFLNKTNKLFFQELLDSLIMNLIFRILFDVLKRLPQWKLHPQNYTFVIS
jgi:hypothetical protein